MCNLVAYEKCGGHPYTEPTSAAPFAIRQRQLKWTPPHPALCIAASEIRLHRKAEGLSKLSSQDASASTLTAEFMRSLQGLVSASRSLKSTLFMNQQQAGHNMYSGLPQISEDHELTDAQAKWLESHQS